MSKTAKRVPNKRLAFKIARVITAEPRRFVMGDWVRKLFKLGELPMLEPNGMERRTASIPPCKTAGCIAAHAVIEVDGVEKARNMTSGQIAMRGAKLMGLPTDNELFATSSWPDDLYDRYNDNVEIDPAPPLRILRSNAAVAAEAIKRYFKGDGKGQVGFFDQ